MRWIAALFLSLLALPVSAQTIDALSAAAALTGPEAVPLFQTANPAVKTTASAIKTFTSASPTLVTPVLGVATGTSLAIGGCTIGANAACVTGATVLGNTTIGAGAAITSSGAGGALGTNAFNSTAFAPLASPTFTGTVGLPIATATSLAIGGCTIGTDAFCNTGTTTFNGAVTFASSPIIISGNLSAAAWTTNGVRIKGTPGTLTDTSSSGTVAAAYTDVLGGNTIAASSATTFTNYYSAYFKAPVNGTNVTITNKWALGADTLNVTSQGTNSAPTVAIGATNYGWYLPGGTNLTATIGGTVGPTIQSAQFTLPAAFKAGWSATTDSTSNPDTILTRKAAATLQLGAADAGAPVAQTIGFQSVVAGTADTAGVNTTIKGSASTGSGVSGNIVFQTGGTGAGSTSQNAFVTAMTINGATQLVTLPAIASDATHTDSTVCQDTTTHALYAGSGAAGICLGTSSIRFKNRVTDLPDMGDALLALRPVRYFLNEDHGGNPTKPLYGFIAEDAAPVTPELVGRDAEDRPNTFDLVGVVPMLVQTVQRQQRQLESQEKRLAELERRMENATSTAARFNVNVETYTCLANSHGCVENVQ